SPTRRSSDLPCNVIAASASSRSRRPLMQIIKDRQIIEDSWQVLPAEAELPTSGDFFVGLSLWNDANTRHGRNGKLSLVLRPGDDLSKVTNLDQAAIIAID